MKIYVTDGSSASFFTAVFDAFRGDSVITSDTNIQLSLDSEVIRVDYDENKCLRVLNALERYDPFAEEEILLALRSGNPNKEQTAFNYVKKIFQIKGSIRKKLSLSETVEFNDILHKVTGEIHKVTGFLRFMESSSGALYAPYSPDNDITELLLPHFASRLQSEKFVIHDVRRGIAGIYDGRACTIGYVGEAEICLSENEKAFESLWKKYYQAVNIKERPHEKQMKGYMPVRYWKFLPEKN